MLYLSLIQVTLDKCMCKMLHAHHHFLECGADHLSEVRTFVLMLNSHSTMLFWGRICQISILGKTV